MDSAINSVDCFMKKRPPVSHSLFWKAEKEGRSHSLLTPEPEKDARGESHESTHLMGTHGERWRQRLGELTQQHRRWTAHHDHRRCVPGQQGWVNTGKRVGWPKLVPRQRTKTSPAGTGSTGQDGRPDQTGGAAVTPTKGSTPRVPFTPTAGWSAISPSPFLPQLPR